MAGSADNTQPYWQIPEVGQILHTSQLMQWEVYDTIYEYYQLKNSFTEIREQTLYDCNTFKLWNVCAVFHVAGYVPVSPGLQYTGTWTEFVSYCCVKLQKS